MWRERQACILEIFGIFELLSSCRIAIEDFTEFHESKNDEGDGEEEDREE